MNKTSFSLYHPCTHLKNVGEKTAALLEKIDIFTIQDLLFHLPLRYQDKTRITAINQLILGEFVVVQGTIVEVVTTKSRKPSLICHLSDETGVMALRFFNFNSNQKKQFESGGTLCCFGEVRFWNQIPEIIHPEYRWVKKNEPLSLETTLTPIYPSTEGLYQSVLRRLTTQILDRLQQNLLPELIPGKWLEDLNLSTLSQALQFVHRPPKTVDVNSLAEGSHAMQQRLIIEELLAQHLSLRRVRKKVQNHISPILHAQSNSIQKFIQNLPFQLTTAQKKVLQEISLDMQQTKPMLRLVQGDVGSGKTIVAALAIFQAIENGFQAALMAPTELLAEQHFRQFQKWFSPLDIQVTFLTSNISSKEKAQSYQDMLENKRQIVIGTHAIFQKNVHFKSLGLVVVDEQHRFGVQQRLDLWQKGIQEEVVPHQLILTATPIPRSLAMVFYADLDVSIIDELPPGRTPITTVVLPDSRRDEIIQRIQNACSQGKQAYWVCPLIEESESLQCQAVEVIASTLKKLLPKVKIELVHGRMKSQEKETVMQAFRAGSIDLLVATTVIEVGVDVPNASLMIIENAERLGLSQLHQLRGRVGRGSVISYCVLMYQAPLSPTAQQRLEVIRNSQDGFEIAKKDLELRGPGEVLGTRQTGAIRFRIANLIRDQKWLPKVQDMAEKMLSDYPEYSEALIVRWLEGNDKYGLV